MTSSAAEDAIPNAGMDVLEAIYTTRAMRRLKPDPIPAEVLRQILDAAIHAPSGGNSQGWSFVAVQDVQLKQALQQLYQPQIEVLFQPGGGYYAALNSSDPAVKRATERVARSALHLGRTMHEAPVIVIPCIQTGGRGTNIITGSSIYPAVQNLMLAARAFGIGSCLTTVHRAKESEVRALLGIPDGWETAALIPLGYPTGRWGTGPRRPLDDVAFGDRWGEKMPA